MIEKLDPREIADLYDVPVWLVSPKFPKTRKELWRWRLRRLRRWWT